MVCRTRVFAKKQPETSRYFCRCQSCLSKDRFYAFKVFVQDSLVKHCRIPGWVPAGAGRGAPESNSNVTLIQNVNLSVATQKSDVALSIPPIFEGVSILAVSRKFPSPLRAPRVVPQDPPTSLLSSLYGLRVCKPGPQAVGYSLLQLKKAKKVLR